MSDHDPEQALLEIARVLTSCGVRFSLVGGLAVSVRAEVRFTRDVDVAIDVTDDAAVEALVSKLRNFGYRIVALASHDECHRLATVRLLSKLGVVVDLIVATCGIENEIVRAAIAEQFGDGEEVPVARAEDLLAMKILSMTDRRLQDRIDARNLLTLAQCDVETVRGKLKRIEALGFHRGQDLQSKLESVIVDAAGMQSST